jgi:sec-independent protein translocase protein TatA
MTAIYVPVLGIFGLSGGELAIVAGVIVLLFGATKLPQLAKGLGQSMKEFKKAAKEGEEEEKAASETKVAAKTGEPSKSANH